MDTDIANIKEISLKLFSQLGIEEDAVTIETEDETILISAEAPEDERGLLIGRHAETLDSLQKIISLMVNNGRDFEDHIRILVDVGGYRKERFTSILEKAKELADIVKKTGEPKPISNLSPTERRQVHMFFATDDTINTYSQGEGEERSLFIALT